eukprot:9901624-Heterocapsa_arctica.AAC.1
MGSPGPIRWARRPRLSSRSTAGSFRGGSSSRRSRRCLRSALEHVHASKYRRRSAGSKALSL